MSDIVDRATGHRHQSMGNKGIYDVVEEGRQENTNIPPIFLKKY